MDRCFKKYFVEHPESVNESYWQHFCNAASFGTKLIFFGAAEYIHALIPGIDLFETFGTHSYLEIEKLYNQLKKRKLD
tara:strand:- start:394 stop:627 length:234 start_codon:yes stop_codon:yes gene_type:complete